MAQTKIAQLQLLQQNLQGVLAQKQQLESELIELESALKEASTSPQTYKIIGKIMVLAPKAGILKELEEKKTNIILKITSFTKQEDKIKENLESLQQEVLFEMKSKNG